MAEQAVPPTVVVEDSQVQQENQMNTQLYEYKHDGNVGVAHSQQTEYPENTPAVEVPKEDSLQEPPAAAEVDPLAQGSQSPAVEVPQDGEQHAEGQRDPPVPSGSMALEKSVTWLQSVDDDADLQATCKKCHQLVALDEAIIRGPKELWCRECNALYTMLQRHQCWPPQSFASLTEDAQVDFFQKRKKQKQDSDKGRMCYSRVRDVLINTLVEEQKRERTTEVGGTFLPKSVYLARGYVIDADFEKRNPKRWSDGLNDWVYLLAEVSINEKEIHATVERQVVEAERTVKKRKAQAVEDTSKTEVASTTSLMDGNMDLESEEEAQEGRFFFYKQKKILVQYLSHFFPNLEPQRPNGTP